MYDPVKTYIDKYEPIAVTTCYGRHGALLRGEDIHDMPTDVRMQFGPTAQYCIDRLGGRAVNKTEAMVALRRAETAGPIHKGQNVAEDIGFICNLDRCFGSLVYATGCPRKAATMTNIPGFIEPPKDRRLLLQRRKVNGYRLKEE